jgi:hypothetical protein
MKENPLKRNSKKHILATAVKDLGTKEVKAIPRTLSRFFTAIDKIKFCKLMKLLKIEIWQFQIVNFSQKR